MVKLDGKFTGIITKHKDNTIVPQDQYIVFLAKDNALPTTLLFYEQECVRLGAKPEQIRAVSEMLERLIVWRENHPELCKVPDVQSGEIITSSKV